MLEVNTGNGGWTLDDNLKERRLAKLRKKLAARENTPGYEKNCMDIRAAIEVLERPKQEARSFTRK